MLVNNDNVQFGSYKLYFHCLHIFHTFHIVYYYVSIVSDVVCILNGRIILYNLIFNYCKNKIKKIRIKIDTHKNS